MYPNLASNTLTTPAETVTTPTPEELAQIQARSTERQFNEWSDDQRAVYLAVFRNHTDPPAVAKYLNWSAEKTAAVLGSMYGWLLWGRSKPNADISIRD